MPLTDHIPEYLHSKDNLIGTLAHLHSSKYSLRFREAAFLDWCDKTGHTPIDDELESLKIRLP